MSRIVAVGVIALLGASCGESSTSPTTTATRLTFGAPTPGSGATIQTVGTPPGAFIESGSNKLFVPLTVEAGSDEAIARLFVYAKDAGGTTCAQNLPDAPDLAPLKRGTVQTVTITAFQVFRLPCEVASLRAVLHRRESRNLNTEITATEMIGEQTVAVSYHFR